MAKKLITGFEHGAMSVNGGGLFDAIGGSPTVTTGSKRSGTYGLRLYNPSGGTYVSKTISGSPTVLVGRFYIYLEAADFSANGQVCLINTGSEWFEFKVQNAGGATIFFNASIGGSGSQNSANIYEDTQYRIDFRLIITGSTGTIDWQINGSAQTQVSASVSGSSFSSLRFGWPWETSDRDAYFDDIIISDATGDYPFGAGEVIGLSPNAEGTHNSGSVIKDHNDNIIADPAYPAAPLLDDVPMNSQADYVQQTANGTGNYAELLFADIGAGAINGVMGVLAYDSDAVQANEGACIAIDSESTETEIWGRPEPNQEDYSETSLFYKSAALPAPSGGWDQAEINALKMRIGYSGDANPDPRWQALMIEVDYVPSVGYTLVCDGGTYSISGQAASPLYSRILGLEGGNYSISGQIADLLLSRLIPIGSGNYAISGQAADLLKSYLLGIESGTFSINGQIAGVLYARIIPIGAGNYVITGQDVGVFRNYTLVPEAGNYVITGQLAALLKNSLIPIGSGNYAIAGQVADLIYTTGGYVLVCEGGSYAISGQTADVLKSSRIDVGSGSLVISGQDAQVLYNRLISAASGNYAISGQLADLLKSSLIAIDSGVYALAGQDVTFVFSGAKVYVLTSEGLLELKLDLSAFTELKHDMKARTEDKYPFIGKVN